jgi:hypothetical protein
MLMGLCASQGVRDEMAHIRLADELRCRRLAMRKVVKDLGSLDKGNIQAALAKLQAEDPSYGTVDTRAQVNEWIWGRVRIPAGPTSCFPPTFFRPPHFFKLHVDGQSVAVGGPRCAASSGTKGLLLLSLLVLTQITFTVHNWAALEGKASCHRVINL